jgi:hypothetical protein
LPKLTAIRGPQWKVFDFLLQLTIRPLFVI